MGEREKNLEKLKTAVEEGREYFEKPEGATASALKYIDDRIIPPLKEALEEALEDCAERHKLAEAEEGEVDSFIHYTSIATLVSMLQNASPSDEGSSLRLYDSIHLNDPDEGNYFGRNLNLPKEYGWLNEKDPPQKRNIQEKKDKPYAYIASFIIPDTEKDMDDNLVFWRTYGKEGEGCSLSLKVPKGRLKKVLYGAEEVKETWKLLPPVLDPLRPLVEVSEQPIGENIQKKLAQVVWESLEEIRYLYKSEAYDYENECRFVLLESDIPNKDEICFEYQEQSGSSSRIRHYYEHKDLNIRKLLTSGSSITIGPCVPYPNDVKYCLEALRRKANKRKTDLIGPKVNISTIFYRVNISTISYRKS